MELIAPGAVIPVWIIIECQANAKVPNVPAQLWPIKGITTAQRGATPMPIRRGAVTKTGTPKPVTPCKKLANTMPIDIILSNSLGASFLKALFKTENELDSWLVSYKSMAVIITNIILSELHKALSNSIKITVPLA